MGSVSFGSRFQLKLQTSNKDTDKETRIARNLLGSLAVNFRRQCDKGFRVPKSGELDETPLSADGFYARRNATDNTIEIACLDRYDGWLMDNMSGLLVTAMFSAGEMVMGQLEQLPGSTIKTKEALTAVVNGMRGAVPENAQSDQPRKPGFWARLFHGPWTSRF